MQSAERVSSVDASDNFVFQRSLLAYHEAASMVGGDVLEIGTGSGYGVDIIAPRAQRFVTVDKHNPSTTPGGEEPVSSHVTQCNGYEPGVALRRCDFDKQNRPVQILRAKVPPLPFPDASFDAVVSFQVIEHVRRDEELVSEIARILRPGGRLIISTPNRKMSLTRNPWHVREYTVEEFARLLGREFASVERLGVFGAPNVMEYFARNRRSVARVLRWDILRLNRWLPRVILKLPYDIANRLNRKRLLAVDESLTSGIKMSDYHLALATDECFDLYYIATKR